jgi:hypothetical protein
LKQTNVHVGDDTLNVLIELAELAAKESRIHINQWIVTALLELKQRRAEEKAKIANTAPEKPVGTIRIWGGDSTPLLVGVPYARKLLQDIAAAIKEIERREA